MATPGARSTAYRSRFGVVLAALALGAAFAPSTLAVSQVTRGDIHEFNGGDPGITGRAQMIRTADGKTIVSIHVEGLAAGVTYAAHVHAAACATSLADGHYKFDPAGAASPPNEIWPGPFTANEAGIGNAGTIAEGTAGPAAVSVVIHAPGGFKIACADLG